MKDSKLNYNNIAGMEQLKNPPKASLGADVLWAQDFTNGIEGDEYVVRHWIPKTVSPNKIIMEARNEIKLRKRLGQECGNFRFERLEYHEAVEKGVLAGFDVI